MPPHEPSGSAKRIKRNRITDTVMVKNWVTTVTTQQQIKVVNFLLWAYGALLTATMLIFFLQGFKLWGFSLDVGLLRWLGGATVGEVAGLLALTFRAIFRSR